MQWMDSFYHTTRVAIGYWKLTGQTYLYVDGAAASEVKPPQYLGMPKDQRGVCQTHMIVKSDAAA